MDPLTDWAELAIKATDAQGIPDDPYFSEYRNFDHLFNDALNTLEDLDIPSGYAQAQVPPALAQHMPRHLVQRSQHLRHCKKPSGTAIFGFLDHNRELSLSTSNDDVFKYLRPVPETARSISPTRLAKYLVLNEQLDLNFDEPFDPADRKNDLLVTTSSPGLYKFPPRLDFDLDVQPIGVPQPSEVYPDDIDHVLEAKPKKYVPIPVHNPMSPGRHLEPVLSASPSHIQRHAARQPAPPHPSLMDQLPDLAAHHTLRHGPCPGASAININDTNIVYLPPPLSSLGGSPEPPSPPQALSLPRKPPVASLPFERQFYQPQFFSDGYYNPLPCELPGLLQSSPIRAPGPEDETVTDINETILQVTPLRKTPRTPGGNRITLEWSPIISPSKRNSRDVRKAIQELSPKVATKKTSLLPPGELDRYWTGPDDDKMFTCTYNACGKKFTRRYNVRSHIQTHLSDRPFMCLYCPKSFVRQHDLNRHVKSHMFSKHCRCKCGKEFTRGEGYRKHLASGACVKEDDKVSKPAHRMREAILDGLTSNRLHEEMGLL